MAGLYGTQSHLLFDSSLEMGNNKVMAFMYGKVIGTKIRFFCSRLSIWDNWMILNALCAASAAILSSRYIDVLCVYLC